ncbi:hypothetical protein A5810_002785 [Enterococcus faecium]|uniref:Uncharacterized protein n=1 Tax=Enterococcus faecium TaxID=1352 RepID=A0A2C9X2C3_ENTFC|nr:hypothetical protein A5810_002785 [Enterococcus faecium]
MIDWILVVLLLISLVYTVFEIIRLEYKAGLFEEEE